MSFSNTLTLHPGHDAVTQAQTWLESAASYYNWPGRTTFALQLSLDEALANVITHGFPDAGATGTKQIKLSLAVASDHVTLTLIDNGVAYDPTRHDPHPLAESLDEATPGGHGLRLMRHYLQDLSYHRSQGRNHLHLTAALG